MKKLLKNFRIWNLCVIFIVSILCLRACCVSGAASSDYHKGDREEPIKAEQNGKSRTLDAVVDLEEEKVRSYVSDQENPKEIPTKLKINGDLATPSPNSNIKLGFVPRQTYVQVRRYDTEVHLPRSAAVAEAETPEDVLNAPRLREVVSHTKKQEVYEEQGYEDTAYDHGGYKKAGEHHEKKIIPREQKTDFTHLTDQSTEAAQIVKVGRHTTTESSQSVTQPVTTERASNRRPKRPKSPRGAAWLRHRQANNKEVDKEKRTQSTTTPRDEEKVTPHRRRKHKVAKSSSDESKNMDESKLIATRKDITELDIEPTTYHPPVPAKLLSKLYAKKNKIVSTKKPFFKPPRVSKEGYRFEDPFEQFKDYSEIKMVTYPSVTKTKTRALPESPYKPYLYSPQYRMNEVSAPHGESRETNKLQSAMMLLKPAKKPDIATQYLLNEMPLPLQPTIVLIKPVSKPEIPSPYRLNEGPVGLPVSMSNYAENPPTTVMLIKPAKEPENEYYKKFKNFPYEIVESLKMPWSEKIVESMKIPWSDKKKSEKRVRINFPYKIVDAGKNGNRKKLSKKSEKHKKMNSFSFGEPDNSPWIPLTPKEVYDIHGYNAKRTPPRVKVTEDEPTTEQRYNKKLAPIRVYDLPKKVSTSYRVHHIYKPEKTIHSEAAAESTNSPNAESTISRVTVSPDNYITSSEVKPSYDIITAHSSDIRNSYSPSRDSSTSTNKPTQSSSTSSESRETVTKKDRESVEEIETLSSNRYSVFHRTNTTNPVESTTSSLNEVNDEFNRLFLDEQEKFLFRHPHLSRETSRFIKPHSEDTTVTNSTTTKRDIVLTNLKNGSITHLTKVSKRDDNYVRPMLIYPEDYSSSAKYVERLTAAHYSIPENAQRNPLPLDYQQRLVSLTNILKNDTIRIKREIDEADEQEADFENHNEELVTVSISGSTTEIPVNVKKYPFYKTTPARGLSKYSVLRYISNPHDIPTKQNGKMSFYESRRDIECEEPKPPERVVPEREEGEWGFDPKPKLPRIQLGDKITCLKVKFFGSDPLDNPFFKEETIGFPEVLTKHKAEQVENFADQFSKRFMKLKTKKNRTPRDTDSLDLTMSPVRRWIESLATPSKNRLLFKRSAIQNSRPSSSEEEAKQVQKVIFVGGFLGHGNVKKRPSRKSTSTELPLFPVESSSENEIIKPDSILNPHYQGAQHFNEELGFTSEPTSSEVIGNDEEVDFSSRSTTERVPQNSIHLPSAPRIVTSKIKKHYVDALSSLRNLQNSTTTNSPVSEHRYMPKYKEPTWRYKKTEPTKATPVQDSSLLYVIHPNGEGKWMRLLKVEEISSDDSRFIERDSMGSGNIGLPNVVSPASYAIRDYEHKNRFHSNAQTQKVPCQQNEKEENTNKLHHMDYDVYHISGLMKQVAPLKASGVEINSLLTTDEDEINHEDDESNSYYDLNDIHASTTRFPEPHERLYYYVLDDEENADKK